MIRSADEFVDLRLKDDARATHDEAPESVWLEVIRRFPDFKAWVAHNKTVPITILRVLARDSNVEVRFAVAMKRKCPHDVFELLAFDKDESVRARVAWNANAPEELLEMLRTDPCKEVNEAVAARFGEE